MISRGSLRLGSHTLEVGVCASDENQDEDSQQEQAATILVSGLDSDCDTEELKSYFENKKRTGGGRVKQIALDDKKRQAIITFDSREGLFSLINLPTYIDKGTLDQK